MVGLNNTKIGNNSNLPIIITNDKTNFEKLEYIAYEPYGPTKFNPGPTLLIHAYEAVKLVVKSKLSTDINNTHKINTIKYTIK